LRTYDLRMGALYTDAVGYPITSLSPSLMPSTAAVLVLLSTQGGPCHLFDRSAGTSLKTYTAEGFNNAEFRLRPALAFADRFVISGSEDGRVFVWDTGSGECVHILDGDSSGKVVSAVAVRTGFAARKPETGIWCSAAVDGGVTIWGHAQS